MAVIKGIGAAVKGFGKALKRATSKKAGTIKSVKPATRLSERRKTFESAIKTLDKAKKGASPETQMRMKSRTQPHVKDLSKIQDTYDKKIKKIGSRDRKLKRKAIGAGAAAAAGATVAHGTAKKKFPKYKKVMESDVFIKDGKLGLKERKK